MDDGVKGRTNDGAGREKEVDSQMNGAAFVGGVVALRECGRGVDGAGFVVPANADECAGTSEFLFDCPGECRSLGVARVCAQEGAADA